MSPFELAPSKVDSINFPSDDIEAVAAVFVSCRIISVSAPDVLFVNVTGPASTVISLPLLYAVSKEPPPPEAEKVIVSEPALVVIVIPEPTSVSVSVAESATTSD